MSTELIIFKFPSITGADDLLEVLKRFQAQHFVEVYAAVVAKKYDEQHVDVRQSLGSGPRKGAAAGALTGALLGLPGGPAGAAVGLADRRIGRRCGRGRATSRARRARNSRAWPRYELQSGESALLVYADSLWSGQIEQVGKDVDAEAYRRSTIQYAEMAAEGVYIYKPEIEESRKEQLDRVYASWEEDWRRRGWTRRPCARAKAATQAERAKIQQKIAEANAKRDEFYQNVLWTLEVHRQQIDADIARLEAEAKQAQAKVKTEIEQQLTAAREAHAMRREKVRATLEAELNDLKADVASLKAELNTASSEMRAKWEARVAKLEADRAAEKRLLEQLDKAEFAAWDAMSQGAKQAFDTYRDAVRKAENDFRKGA